MSHPRRLATQRGTSVFGLAVIAVIVGFFLLMGARVFPSINEYLTIRKAVSSIMRSNPASPGDVRSRFDKTIEVEYSIKSISGKDLDIAQLPDGGMRTSFAYNIEIPIVEPVYLLVKYSGSATAGGVKGP